MMKCKFLLVIFISLPFVINAQDVKFEHGKKFSNLKRVKQSNEFDNEVIFYRDLDISKDSLSKKYSVFKNKLKFEVLNTSQDEKDKSIVRNSWLTNEPPVLVYPSPTASSLINKSIESVDLYTGKLNVNIPIYQLKSRDLTVPVYLSYNTSGIKVDEVAGWVGLGWSLNAGGAISRVMKGLPDEGNEGKFMPFAYKSSGDGIESYGYLNIMDRDEGIDLANFQNESELQKKKIIRNAEFHSITGLNIGDGLGFGEAWDTQPDEFYFNFGNYSGKFVFDQYGNIHTIPKQNLTITKAIEIFTIEGRDIPAIVKFTVKTPEGIEYTFGGNLLAVEQTAFASVRRNVKYKYIYYGVVTCPGDYYNSNVWGRTPSVNLVYDVEGNIVSDISDYRYVTPYFTSTWYLTQIESPSGDKIILDYVKHFNCIGYVRSRQERVKMPNLSRAELFNCNQNPPVSVGWWFISQPNDETPNTHLQEVTFSRNEVVIDNSYLSSISASSGGRIGFSVSETEREDLLGANSLKYIIIYDKNNKVIKQFEFVYKYQSPETFEEIIEYALGNYEIFSEWSDFINEDYNISEQKRLFLKGIYEIGMGGSKALPPYLFEYNDQLLPRRTSYKQDLWGYYNGNSYGTHMPPIIYTATDGSIIPYDDCPYPLMIWYMPSASGRSYWGRQTNPDENLAKAGILEKIIYPTGGSKEFKYDLNTQENGTNSYGLRIKEIKSYSSNENQDYSIVKSYIYSGGKKVKNQLHNYSLPINSLGNYDVFGNSVAVNSSYDTKGSSIGYKTVTEYQTGKGKTIYTFKNPDDFEIDPSPIYEADGATFENTFPYTQDLNIDWLRGLIEESKVTLDDENKILSKNKIEYNMPPDDYNSDYVYGLQAGIYNSNNYLKYRGGLYKYQSGWYSKKNIIQTDFDSNNPGVESKAVTTNKEYEYKTLNYNTKLYLFLDKEISHSSDMSDLTVEYTYSLDYIQSSKKDNYNEFDNSKTYTDNEIAGYGIIWSYYKHQINNPVETIFKKDNKIIGAKLNLYKPIYLENKSGFNVIPYKSLSLKLDNPLLSTNFTESSYGAGLFHWDEDKYKPDYTIIKNDNNNGNILEIQKENDVSSSFIWAYDDTYPVVKADNVNYEDLEATVNSALLASGVGQVDDITDFSESGDKENWRQFNEQLRNEIPNAMISTYTFNPAIGMSSETGPDGKTSYYEFDEFGKLETIKNQDNNVLNHTDYEYRLYPPPDIEEINGKSEIYFDKIHSYSIPKLPGAEEYHWTLPQFADLISENQNLVRIQYTAPGPGTISVYASSEDWTDDSETVSLNVNATLCNNPVILGPSNVHVPYGETVEVEYTLENCESATDYIWDIISDPEFSCYNIKSENGNKLIVEFENNSTCIFVTEDITIKVTATYESDIYPPQIQYTEEIQLDVRVYTDRKE